MHQILPHCRSWLQQVISAENSPFAQRMRSLPLVLRHFAFFYDSSAAYYQMGLLNVLHVSKTMLAAGSITPPSGTQVALVVRRIFPFVNCSLFSACDLQQDWHTSRNYHLILSNCANIKSYHTDNTPLVTLAPICNSRENAEWSDACVVPSMLLLCNWKFIQQLVLHFLLIYSLKLPCLDVIFPSVTKYFIFSHNCTDTVISTVFANTKLMGSNLF